MTEHARLLDPALLGTPASSADRVTKGGPVLEAIGIHKKYGPHEVLRGVTFEAARGHAKVVLVLWRAGTATKRPGLHPRTPTDPGHCRPERTPTDPAFDRRQHRRHGTRSRGLRRQHRALRSIVHVPQSSDQDADVGDPSVVT